MLSFEPLVARWESFGWHTQRVDGNDIAALVQAFDTARALLEPRPRMIICDTLMGKGVPFLETREKTHFIRVETHEWQLALDQLAAGRHR
jgi:transketolase